MTKRWLRTTIELTATAAMVALPVLLTAGPARAAVPMGEQLYKKDGCATCHAIDQKIVGPSYVAVANKFAGKPDAVATLVAAVKKGHVGTWGQVPMPAHPNLPDSEIKQIVEWILTLKK